MSAALPGIGGKLKILVLSTWFPYPLSQGSKIRAYYLIRALADKHDVTLISFEDVPLQPEWVEHMQALCSRVEVVPRNPFAQSQVKKIKGWFSSQPSAVIAGYSEEMDACVRRVFEEEAPDLVLAFTFVTAPYALKLAGVPRIIDVDNYLSRYFYEEYEKAGSMALKARRWLTWQKFNRYEDMIFRSADLCLVVSEFDRLALRTAFSLPASQVQVISNGVDTRRNTPGQCEPTPCQLVFNGSITYQANYDALEYFLGAILPLIVLEEPEVNLLVTGSTGDIDLAALPNRDRVTFTGYLDDVRPAVASSWACVVPLRIGAGTRLKILEAMALGTPVVTTSKGAEGLQMEAGKEILIADDARTFAEQVVRLLRDDKLRASLSGKASARVKERYDWQAIGSRLVEVAERTAVGEKLPL